MANTTTNTENPQQDAWTKREAGVLWKRQKQGTNESYLVGTINLKNAGFDKDVPVVVFTNKRKQNNTHPDLRIYISEKPPVATAKRADSAPVAAPQPAADTATPNDLI